MLFLYTNKHGAFNYMNIYNKINYQKNRYNFSKNSFYTSIKLNEAFLLIYDFMSTQLKSVNINKTA
jgi:hypothetical protein